MVNPMMLNETLAFAPQLQCDDLAQLAELGYKRLIANRPDEEEIGQPSIADLTNVAESLGLSIIFAPVANNQFTETVIETVATALAKPEKTLMFCRTGTRSCLLWSIIQIRQGAELEQVLQQTVRIGYDLSQARELIMSYAKNNA